MKDSDESRSSWLRVGAVAAASLCLFGVIAAAFWHEDIRYSLPTPRPPELHQPPLGSAVPVAAWLSEAGLDASRRPVLVHFFNPECPCSRFNVDHLKTLQARFGDRVFIVAAVQTTLRGSALDAKLQELGLGIPSFLDRAGKHAAEAGVYSTPQAALVDEGGRLVYRGNYNTSRYCTDPRTEFVRIALEKLVGAGSDLATSSRNASELPAYGCELPSAGLMASQTE